MLLLLLLTTTTTTTNLFRLPGVANPAGEEAGYNGLFLTEGDIDAAVQGEVMNGLPVKIEHKGVPVGKVVTSWVNKGKMELLIDVDEHIFEGNVVSRFVRDNVVKDLSLGYNVALQFSDASQTYVAATKTYNEVSIVRTGARNGCHINGYSIVDSGGGGGGGGGGGDTAVTHGDTDVTHKRLKCTDFSRF
jgi:hypothetical protein